jgi:hypothetical protein
MPESRKPRKPSLASELIGLHSRPGINPDVLRSRLQDRDQREAGDTRTEAQRWLGDPPPDRSALAQRKASSTRR